jgi:hypothetical protein
MRMWADGKVKERDGERVFVGSGATLGSLQQRLIGRFTTTED